MPLRLPGSGSGGGSGFDVVAAALLRGSIRRPGLQKGARPPLVVAMVTGGGRRRETRAPQTRLEDHTQNTSRSDEVGLSGPVRLVVFIYFIFFSRHVVKTTAAETRALAR